MKRVALFIFLIFGMMSSIVAQESNTSTYILSRETFAAAEQPSIQDLAYHKWNFKTNNCTLSLINGVGGINAGNPSYNASRILLNKDVQFHLIGIAESESIQAITFEGNGIDGKTYLTELDGFTKTATADTKSLDATNGPQSIEQNFGNAPIGRSITFTFSEANAQISKITIKTTKVEIHNANNKTWDFSNGFATDADNFIFGQTSLKGYSYNGTRYDSGKGSENTEFRGIYISKASASETEGDTYQELSSTKGLEVNGRNQIFSNAIGVLSNNCLRFHVEKGQQIVISMRTHTTNHNKVDGNSLTYTMTPDETANGSQAESNETSTDFLINEWGYSIQGSSLSSQIADVKLVALKAGYVTLKNVSDTYLYIQRIALDNFTPNVIWSDKDPLVNTAKGEVDFTKDMQLQFPTNNHVKFAIIECGNGTVTWKSFNTRTGEFNGINGNGGLVVAAYFMNSDYFNNAQNTYVLNVTNESIAFAEKEPTITWSKQGYVTYNQKLSGNGLTPFAACKYKVISKPNGWKAEISQDLGSPDYILSVTGSGSGIVTVEGTFGTQSDQYNLHISGLTFGDNSPSIAYGTSEYLQSVIETQDMGSTTAATYSIGTKIGDVTADIEATTGKLTNIKGSGAIQVIAKAVNSDSDLEAEYVLTVGCDPDKKKVWDFFSQPLTLTADGRLGDTPQSIGDAAEDTKKDNFDAKYWKFKYKSYQYTNGELSYFQDPIYAYSNPVDGDNALIIKETAGLQFKCDAEKFGIQNRATDSHYRNVKFSAGSTLTIPKLKKGQYVMIYWDPYAGGEGQSGSTFTATNVLDLEGREVKKTFQVTGMASDWNTPADGIGAQPWGATSFQVEEDGDVSFTIADNGWNDIVKIVVDNSYDTPFQIATNNYIAGKGFLGQKICSANHNNMLLAGKTLRISGYPQETHSMSAATPDFEIRQGEDLVDREDTVEFSKRGVPYNIIKITPKIGKFGNVLVTQTVYGNTISDETDTEKTRYAFEKKEAWLVVGDLTQQLYPYTWDFTKYNCNWLNETEGNPNATIIQRGSCYSAGAWGDGNGTGNGFGIQSVSGYWEGSNHWKDNLYPDVKVCTPNIDKPLFANGAELNYNDGTPIKETQGLGILLTNESLTGGTISESETANIETANSNINFAATQYGTTYLKLSENDTIKIPKVDEGMYLFIHCTPKDGSYNPIVTSSSGNNAITEGWKNDNQLLKRFCPKGGVWVFYVEKTGDILVTGVTEVFHIAVTNQIKSFSKVGKATESRDCLIDYSQSGVYTNNNITAYCTKNNGEYDTNKNVINIEAINVMKAEEAGLLLYNDYKETINGKEETSHTSLFDVPLFVPATNIKATAFGNNDNNEQAKSPLKAYLKRDHNLEASDDDNYRFIFTNIVYDNADKTETKKETGLGFYIVRKSGLMGKDNQAYLELPSTLFNQENKAKGYVRFSFPDETTDIKDISTPDNTDKAFDSGKHKTGTYYNINGMRLKGRPQQKGLYILDGKKVIIK